LYSDLFQVYDLRVRVRIHVRVRVQVLMVRVLVQVQVQVLIFRVRVRMLIIMSTRVVVCLLIKTQVGVSCVQAEIYVISYLLSVPGRHL